MTASDARPSLRTGQHTRFQRSRMLPIPQLTVDSPRKKRV
jgi:hypothetical protein